MIERYYGFFNPLRVPVLFYGCYGARKLLLCYRSSFRVINKIDFNLLGTVAGSSGNTFIQAIINFFKNIKTVQLWDTLLGVCSIGVLLLLKVSSNYLKYFLIYMNKLLTFLFISYPLILMKL